MKALTIYECPEHGQQHTDGRIHVCPVRVNRSGSYTPCAQQLVPVRVFREEDVRSVTEAAQALVNAQGPTPVPMWVRTRVDTLKAVLGAIAPKPCEAKLYHGPGHQSSTRCRLTGEHEIHEAVYGRDMFAQWRDGSYANTLRERGIEVPAWVDEGTAMTGFFDEPPEVDE